VAQRPHQQLAVGGVVAVGEAAHGPQVVQVGAVGQHPVRGQHPGQPVEEPAWHAGRGEGAAEGDAAQPATGGRQPRDDGGGERAAEAVPVDHDRAGDLPLDLGHHGVGQLVERHERLVWPAGVVARQPDGVQRHVVRQLVGQRLERDRAAAAVRHAYHGELGVPAAAGQPVQQPAVRAGSTVRTAGSGVQQRGQLGHRGVLEQLDHRQAGVDPPGGTHRGEGVAAEREEVGVNTVDAVDRAAEHLGEGLGHPQLRLR
jgi:hypothetical protein